MRGLSGRRRAGLKHVPMARQVAGILKGNAAMLGRALDSDVIVEPVRGPLIPGFR